MNTAFIKERHLERSERCVVTKYYVKHGTHRAISGRILILIHDVRVGNELFISSML